MYIYVKHFLSLRVNVQWKCILFDFDRRERSENTVKIFFSTKKTNHAVCVWHVIRLVVALAKTV